MTEEIIKLIQVQNEKLDLLNQSIQELAFRLRDLNSIQRQHVEDVYLRNRGDL